MKIDDLVKLRPFIYHTTSAQNLPRIRRTRVIESTRRLFELAGCAADPRLRERRRDPLQLQMRDEQVCIRDQRPLSAGSIEFDDGWDLARFVEHLNGFAFFWPGSESGAIPYGRRHFECLAATGEAIVVLRVPTFSLFELNHGRRVLFSRANSGSARMNKGKKLPRGESTFRSAEAFASSAGQVKEIVVEGAAALSPETEVADSLAGPWHRL